MSLLSQGTKLQRGNGATPEVFQDVAEVTGITGLGSGQATVVRVSHLGSTAHEKKMGLPDEGQVKVDLFYLPTNSVQVALKTDRANRTLRNFRVVWSDGAVEAFSAYVLTFDRGAPTDDAIKATLTLEISGPIT